MISFKNKMIHNNVFVIGCGGTGSRLIPLVAQKLSKGTYHGLTPTITLIDGDEVELKNLTRQHFILDDVGYNKATTLSERYSEAFGIPIITIPKFYESDSRGRGFMQSIQEMGYPQSMRNLMFNRPKTVFLCVDNMKIRWQIIHDLIQDNYRLGNNMLDVIIDAGNENTYGQTRMFHAAAMDFEGVDELKDLARDFISLAGNVDAPFIPCPVEWYYQNRDSVGVADRSCAELEQTGAVNNLMAASQFSTFQSLYDFQEIYVSEWYYDIHNGNSQDKLGANWIGNLTEDRYSGAMARHSRNFCGPILEAFHENIDEGLMIPSPLL